MKICPWRRDMREEMHLVDTVDTFSDKGTCGWKGRKLDATFIKCLQLSYARDCQKKNEQKSSLVSEIHDQAGENDVLINSSIKRHIEINGIVHFASFEGNRYNGFYMTSTFN